MSSPTAKSRLKARLALASRSLFPFLAFLCYAGPLPAQVPIQLTVDLTGANAVPPSGSTGWGTGSLTLIGTNLTYNIPLPLGQWVLELHGPAGPGINAPLIDSLGSCGPLIPLFSDIAVSDNASHGVIIWIGFLPPCLVQGGLLLTENQVNDLLGGLLYVEAFGMSPLHQPLPPPPGNPPLNPPQQPVPLLRGQILPVDSDHDGVPDYRDLCPDTPPGSIVNADGCSIDQLCPCDGPWKNHGEYVNALKDVSATFLETRLITEEERQALVRQAAASDCGKAQ